ncbi:PIG-L deacetylase family protein [Haloarcula sp. GH36]|uniref:PIG-L deacetylase family protein n=1 Tax=Haloarcula montana TaxID=3111776 RepID=UPI002D766897|nr:PIG-L deacetylase family protein [Haloarcula sp. GH36]
MSVLCVVAHPDDEVIGVGGTLARHASDSDDIHVCILSDGVTSRYDDIDRDVRQQIEQRKQRSRDACDRLGVTSTSFHQFPDNQFDSVPLLEIVQTIEREIDTHEPDVVYTHHYSDLNVDHELACRATVTATRPLSDSGVDRVLAFETLSATEWSVTSPDNAFQPTSFVNIEETLDAKLDAISCYQDELREPPHPRTKTTIRNNAEVWGAKAGVPAAEPFSLLREVRR